MITTCAASKQTIMTAEMGVYSGLFGERPIWFTEVSWNKSFTHFTGYLSSLPLYILILTIVRLLFVQLLKFICSKTSVFEYDYNFSQCRFLIYSISGYCASIIFVKATVLGAKGTEMIRHRYFLPSRV